VIYGGVTARSVPSFPLRTLVGGPSDCRDPLKRTNMRQMTSVWLSSASPLPRNSDQANFSETKRRGAMDTT
jgi:hypothetical protein